MTLPRGRSGLAKLAFGQEVPSALTPLLAVTLVSTIANAGVGVLLGVWALKELGASPSQLGAAYAVSAVACLMAGFLSGRLADRATPRSALLFCLAVQAVAALLFLAAFNNAYFGLGLLVVWQMSVAAVATVENVMAVSVEAECSDEVRFGMLRVAQNAGWILGPLAAAALVPLGWPLLFAGAALATALSWRFALALPALRHPPEEGDPMLSSLGEMLRNRYFVVLFLGGLLGECVYVAFEYLLPISLVDFHGFSPSAAALMISLNPILIVLFQVRVLRWLGDRSYRAKLVGSMLGLALAALLMSQVPNPVGVSIAIAIFALAEIVWVPAAQAAVTEIAPDDRVGVYLGTMSISLSLALGLAPSLGLAVQDNVSDGTMWFSFAVAGTLAGAVYLAASQRGSSAPGAGKDMALD